MMRRGIGVALVLLCINGQAFAGRVADILSTKHNLSSQPYANGTDTRAIKATSETQLCVFCHTPHQAENLPNTPLWNRKLSGATYTLYNSSSLDATDLGQPSVSSSKLCLSCHDGTLAIGAVNVLNGSFTDQNPSTADIAMNGTGAGGQMSSGSGTSSGYTRNLGTNLSNDHPISFTYNYALAAADGDLVDPPTSVSPTINNRSPGIKPDIPLDNDKVECISCHDPHIRDTDPTQDIKFLRMNRFQANAGPGGIVFSKTNDIICLACHSKDGWTNSAHADSTVATEIYTAAASALREFPNGIKVWQAACLNCHDPHTVQGARRLLREGTDSPALPKSGGNSAIEQTCYQCHSTDGNTLTTQGVNTSVPDIKSDFALSVHMPIASTDQAATVEVHDIGTANPDVTSQRGKELIESPALLGKISAGGMLTNRHAECTDCHNPHRVTKNRLATSNPSVADAGGTHDHNPAGGHTNIVSGVLRGMWGVEPIYTSSSFHDTNISYTVKKGLQPADGATDVAQGYVTREYQICLKCHSSYGFDDANPPALGASGGGTPVSTNGMLTYTNQAREFQAPSGHEGEVSGRTGGWAAGACGSSTGWDTNNHRSWHPVMKPTGRGVAARGNIDPNVFLPPWNTGIGTQTMYCTDCHGSNTGLGTVEPTGGENGNSWGPHGSSNNFLLKGTWIDNEAGNQDSNRICFKCHDFNSYANPDTAQATPKRSGFAGPPGVPCGTTGIGTMNYCNTNQHIAHAMRIGYMKCNWCHVAVPHGWKNRSLLVSVSDVGPEAGLAPCTTFTTGPYWGGPPGIQSRPPKTFPPYYANAVNPVWSFATSGNWTPANCRGLTYMQDACMAPP